MKIAIVDDDPIFQFMIHKLIERVAPGHQLMRFNDGQDALDFIQRHITRLETLPELILLDINMPILGGWQFLDCLKQLQIPDFLPIIYMVSSSTDQADVLKSQTYVELKGYLPKPLSKEQVMELLNDKMKS